MCCNLIIILIVICLQEIIEFPVLKVNGITFETEAEFHQYVQPDVHKELSDFCTEVQNIVNDSMTAVNPSLLADMVYRSVGFYFTAIW